MMSLHRVAGTWFGDGAVSGLAVAYLSRSNTVCSFLGVKWSPAFLPPVTVSSDLMGKLAEVCKS